MAVRWAGMMTVVVREYTETRCMMRVVIDYDRCESNAVCMSLVPEVFEVRDDDVLYLLDETPPESLRSRIEEAVARCPRQAISLIDT